MKRTLPENQIVGNNEIRTNSEISQTTSPQMMFQAIQSIQMDLSSQPLNILLNNTKLSFNPNTPSKYPTQPILNSSQKNNQDIQKIKQQRKLSGHYKPPNLDLMKTQEEELTDTMAYTNILGHKKSFHWNFPSQVAISDLPSVSNVETKVGSNLPSERFLDSMHCINRNSINIPSERLIGSPVGIKTNSLDLPSEKFISSTQNKINRTFLEIKKSLDFDEHIVSQLLQNIFKKVLVFGSKINNLKGKLLKSSPNFSVLSIFRQFSSFSDQKQEKTISFINLQKLLQKFEFNVEEKMISKLLLFLSRNKNLNLKSGKSFFNSKNI